MRPTVAAALRQSVRNDPRVWAEAFFPILLPAIRLAVTSALRELVTTLNQILEHGLSLRSWRWRLEAWRTGKTFGEILLLRTLVYRVEQLLLLHRNTGLPLASVAAAGVRPKDTALVSAMLTALQDFTSDSFEVDRNAGIRELYVGDFSLLVEQGPRASLAAAVRGNASAELRETLRAAIDLIHQEFGPELLDFRGDPQSFERSGTILEGCLQAQYRGPDTPSYWRLWLVAATVALSLAVWIGFRVEQAWRWERAMAALRNTRGIVVTLASRENGLYFLEGLRDPLAVSPERVLTNSGIDLRKVSIRFGSFLSLDPDLVVKRARAAIDAPTGVSASLDQDVLNLRGAASHAWILQARDVGRTLALEGIHRVHTGELVDSDLEALRGEVEAARILFAFDSSVVTPEQARLAKVVADRTREWTGGVISIGRVPRLEVLGYTDQTGTVEGSLNLSRLRAEHLAEFYSARDRPPVPLDSRRGQTRRQCRGSRRPTKGGRSPDAARIGGQEPAVMQKKICLLGTFSVGKTSLADRFVESLFSDRYRTTVGVRICKKTVELGDQLLNLIIWDLAGEDELVVLRTEYLRGASGYVLVADGTRRDTLDRAIDLHGRARTALGEVPFVLVVNKTDRSEDWDIGEAALEEYAKQGWAVVLTSAKSGRGVEEAFTTIARKVACA
jgi:OOP family OmpA-OmpF porin